jgi:hypothetical protein
MPSTVWAGSLLRALAEEVVNAMSVRKGVAMAKWEYRMFRKRIESDTDDIAAKHRELLASAVTELNQLGLEGWELVSMEDLHTARPDDDPETGEHFVGWATVRGWLKRPVE